jgi:hypothetical protein
MQHKLVRIVLGVPSALNVLSAFGGGIARLSGTYKDGVLIEAGGQGQGEVVMLKRRSSWTLGLYFGLGLLIAGLATSFWMSGHCRHYLQIKYV